MPVKSFKPTSPGRRFQTSMTFVDKDGNPMRYNGYYNNTYYGLGVYAPPPRGPVTADPQ